tara:strand:+ start:5126 stop:5995 length:870 start_codon:yes stop_codon:yes gene_type:complete
MAWKYPQEWFETGDIIEPSDFRLNQQEYLGEINGNLDNDNLYQKMFGQDSFSQYSFNRVYHSDGINNYKATDFGNPDSDYYGGGVPGSKFGNKHSGFEFDMSTGGWISECDGERDRDGDNYPYPQYRPNHLPIVVFDAEEDGMIMVDLSANHTWKPPYHSEYVRGSVDYQVDYGYYRPKGARFQFWNAYVHCIQYRVVCNGFTVCQTGPIGNEYQQQPVYLCGALPISSGRNVVKLEVRFVWYSPGTDKMIDAAARDPEATTTEIGNQNIFLKRNCSITSRLIVTHRKR